MARKTGGTVANNTGKAQENLIEHRIKAEGYQYVPKGDFDASIQVLDQPIYTKQLTICESIYGTPVNCDFILCHPEKYPDCLVIESKWQQSGGSVDEKYPFLILNIKVKSPYKTVLVLDGGGYKKGAEKWIREQADGKKLLAVLNLREFQTWANKGNL